MSRDLSQFISNLNSLEPYHQPQRGGSSSSDDDLAVFSNTEFFDFDMGRSTNISGTVDELLMQQEKEFQAHSKPQAHELDALFKADSSASGADLQRYSIADGLAYSNQMPPLRPSYKTRVNSLSTDVNTGLAPPGNAHVNAPLTARKRRAAAVAEESSQESMSEVSSPTAAEIKNMTAEQIKVMEDDKRRRNTAASARFRIKKKLREQEMERNTRDLQDKVQMLESKVVQLEMENRWLKNLVVEKNDARDTTDLLKFKKDVLSNIKLGGKSD